MKINAYQLAASLNTLKPVYIVSGDEIILKQEAFQLIRKAAKDAGFSDRTRLTPHAGFDWEDLFAQLNSPSLFADKRLIELDLRDHTPNKQASTILQEYAAAPHAANILLLDLNKTDDKITRSAWYKALDKIGATVQVWPISREQLPKWLITRAQKYKLTLKNDAANFLTDYVEGNLLAAAQMLEKIYLLKPAQTIDVTHIESVVSDESHFTIFDFVEALIARNQARALHILDHLELEGIEPSIVLWAITRELRILETMAEELKQGAAYSALCQKHRIFARRQTILKNFLDKFSAQECWQLLPKALHIDKIIKGDEPGNAWEALALFCLRI